MQNHTIIQNALDAGHCFIGRIAGIELQVAHQFIEGTVTPQQLEELENNAGIHLKREQSLAAYVNQLIQAYDHCTHIAEWESNGPVYAATGWSQRWMGNRTPHIPKIPARSLEPYYTNSWMLRGKRILVVHPFTSTLEKQSHRFKELFPDREWFPDCTFEFVKPPLTLAGNHGETDWQDHMAPCLDEIRGKEFDVALVAAGGYGMLISDFIYQRKKSVIYVGGALQLFFGVIGKRWFSNPDILALVNDSWIRPSKEDQVSSYKKVEKGCYW
jgi:hypothetical protein